MVRWYNNRFHITLGMSPVEARKQANFKTIQKEMSVFSEFNNRNYHNKPKYKIGDIVRVLIHLENTPEAKKLVRDGKLTFRKGFKEKWSDVLYKITSIRYNGVWFYKVLPVNPIHITGFSHNIQVAYNKASEIFYYENELIKVTDINVT